jgi:hypothetical protein
MFAKNRMAADEIKGMPVQNVPAMLHAVRVKTIDTIVAAVRAATLRDGEHMALQDPWDEDTSGAGWLENEVGMVTTHVLSRLKPGAVYDISSPKSVNAFKEAMMGWPIADLLLIRVCIETLGGSASRAMWKCRGDTFEQLRARFAYFL